MYHIEQPKSWLFMKMVSFISSTSTNNRVEVPSNIRQKIENKLKNVYWKGSLHRWYNHWYWQRKFFTIQECTSFNYVIKNEFATDNEIMKLVVTNYEMFGYYLKKNKKDLIKVFGFKDGLYGTDLIITLHFKFLQKLGAVDYQDTDEGYNN